MLIEERRRSRSGAREVKAVVQGKRNECDSLGENAPAGGVTPLWVFLVRNEAKDVTRPEAEKHDSSFSYDDECVRVWDAAFSSGRKMTKKSIRVMSQKQKERARFFSPPAFFLHHGGIITPNTVRNYVSYVQIVQNLYVSYVQIVQNLLRYQYWGNAYKLENMSFRFRKGHVTSSGVPAASSPVPSILHNTLILSFRESARSVGCG